MIYDDDDNDYYYNYIHCTLHCPPIPTAELLSHNFCYKNVNWYTSRNSCNILHSSMIQLTNRHRRIAGSSTPSCWRNRKFVGSLQFLGVGKKFS